MIPQPTFTENGTDPGNYDEGCTVQQIAKLKDVTERTVYNALEIKRLTSCPQKK
jgi:hypothetical protein